MTCILAQGGVEAVEKGLEHLFLQVVGLAMTTGSKKKTSQFL